MDYAACSSAPALTSEPTAASSSASARALIEFMQAGGTVIALGDFAVVDEYKQAFENADILSLIGQTDIPVGSGIFSQLRTGVFRADGVVEENLRDIAAIYYQYYIEDNHPAVEQFFYLIGEEPGARISDETAAGIRDEISGFVESAVTVRTVQDTISENIAVQVYMRANPPQILKGRKS